MPGCDFTQNKTLQPPNWLKQWNIYINQQRKQPNHICVAHGHIEKHMRGAKRNLCSFASTIVLHLFRISYEW